MSTITKEFLSGSTSGRGIKIAAIATAGTLLHTAHASAKDEIWLYVYNSHTADVELTLEVGGVTAPDDNIKVSIPSKAGLTVVLPGHILSGGVALRGFAATANVLVAFGFVNRIA